MSEDIRILNAGTGTEDPAALHIHEANPRQGDVGALVESFRVNGFWGRVLVEKSTGRVLVGNHRVLAARILKMKSIPFEYVETDGDEHGLRILIADNRTSDLAAYDDSALAEILQDLAVSEEGLEGTGYDDDDLGELLADMERDWSDGKGSPSVNARNPTFVRPVIAVRDVAVVEAAFRATGCVSRADAFLEICRAYIDRFGDSLGEDEALADQTDAGAHEDYAEAQ